MIVGWLYSILFALFTLVTPCDTLRLSLPEPDGNPLEFSMDLPEGYKMMMFEAESDYAYLFEYGKHCMIYVSNGWSPNVEKVYRLRKFPGPSLPITNNILVKKLSTSPKGELLMDVSDEEYYYDMPDTLSFEGKDGCRYWKEIEYKDCCIGYTGVRSRDKERFDKALASYSVYPDSVDTLSFGNETLVITLNSYFKKEVIPEEEGPIISYILPAPVSFWVTRNTMAEFDIDSFPPLKEDETLYYTIKQGIIDDRCWWIIHIKNSNIRLFYEGPSALNGEGCPIVGCSLYKNDIPISSFLISSVIEGS